MEVVNPNLDDDIRLRSRVAAAIAAGGGVAQMAKLTGIPKGTLEKYSAQTSTPSFANAAKIASSAGLTLDMIAFSHDDISKFGAPARLRQIVQGMSDHADKSGFAAIGRVQPGLIALPFFDGVQASAGIGLTAPLHAATEAMVAFDQKFLRDKGAVPDQCTVITARGDSMTPTIPDGSLLVVDHSQTQIANGCIMVINLGDDLLVKRVVRRLDGRIELISDNPAYPAETLQPTAVQQLRVVGRVVYFCRTP